MKKCAKCNKTEEETRFYSYYKYYCVICHRKMVAVTPKKKGDIETKRKTFRESQQRMRKKYPEKVKARETVRNLIKYGKLKREPCEVCNEVRSHAHHEDYTKPLEVKWLCRFHHDERHRELRQLTEAQALHSKLLLV